METNYKKLIVWQKSIELVKKTYSVTRTFPKEELYALTSQIQRSAVSIPSNIAEGSQRNGSGNKGELRQFLYIAKWSAAELETQLIIAHHLWYVDEVIFSEMSSLILEILKMLSALISSTTKD